MPSFPKLIIRSRSAVSRPCFPSHAQLWPTYCIDSGHDASTSATDPLGRTTPQSTVLGFLHAAQAGDYSIAAQYLQMSPARRQSEGEQLANKLAFVLNQPRAFTGNPRGWSTQPEGTPQEGVALGRQKLGTMSAGDVEADLELVRVSDPAAGKIWLISSDTSDQGPRTLRPTASAAGREQIAQRAGQTPVRRNAALAMAGVVARSAGGRGLRMAVARGARNSRALVGPASRPCRSRELALGLRAGLAAGRARCVHRILAVYLGMPLLQRHYYFQVTSISLIIGATWIVWRGVRWSLRRVRNRALTHGHAGTGSLMLLGERIVKAVVFGAGILAVLGALGFNMSTALAGLGIGGLAIGFGAQQTIANLFGGVSVLGDEVFRVGDVCRFGDRTGTVEDIGLRSTRIRTEERTLLAIPNGTVATINLENLSRREKILFKTNLGLRLDTKPDHVRYVLSEIRRLLYSHPKIETTTVRVRLTDIAGSALNIELVSYILTQDFNEFAAVREDLLLRIMDVLEDSGGGLALPSQTLYLSRDSGVEKEKAETAAEENRRTARRQAVALPRFSSGRYFIVQGIDRVPAAGVGGAEGAG